MEEFRNYMYEAPPRNPMREGFFKRLNIKLTPQSQDFYAYAVSKQTTGYTASDYRKIYNFPAPSVPRVFGIVSLGGGLFGTLKNGILTNGDVQRYWTNTGIPAASHPVVYVQSIDGASMIPRVNDRGATAENTLDVATIGSCCPGAANIIILYIAPATFNGFYNAFNAAINGSVVVNGRSVSPTIVSCSWGAPEKYWGASNMAWFDALFAAAVAKGINITAATGDTGASNGLPGLNADFPSSSPNVIACGGTSLFCPTRTYTGAGTKELTWAGTGGGISSFFAKPAYQSIVAGTKRNTPDVAMNADPNTGVQFLLNGKKVVWGGTSIVSPAMAAYIGCLPKSVGFIVPALYNNPTTFNDITLGHNGGYFAKGGYDNCTGLGSLNGTALAPRL